MNPIDFIDSQPELTMSAHYTRCSWMTRLVSALVASVITPTLFLAVAMGLTGEEASDLLAAGHQATAQASARAA